MLANLVMLIAGLSGIRAFTKIVQIPKSILNPVIVMMCVIGAYAVNGNFLDILVMFISGIIGYFLVKGGFPLSPIVLALILGPMAEGNLRRSLVMSHGSWAIFFERPIAAAFIVISLVAFFYPIIKGRINYHKEKKVAEK